MALLMTASTAEVRATVVEMDAERAMAMAVATAVATTIDALRATALVIVVAGMAVKKTAAATAEARATAAEMTVLRATAIVMRALTAGAMVTAMAAVRLVTQQWRWCWKCNNKVNKDNNNNLTTTWQPT